MFEVFKDPRGAKIALRSKMLSQLNFFDFREDDFANVGCAFFQTLSCCREIPNPLYISAYWPMGDHEMPTQLLLKALYAQGHHCLLPVPVKGSKPFLQFVEWTPTSQLVKGPLGTWVPASGTPVFNLPNIVLLPLVAYDDQGYRLGRGGGYYDATLRFLRANATGFLMAVGLAHSMQKIARVPREIHDEKMDAVLTELGYVWF